MKYQDNPGGSFYIPQLPSRIGLYPDTYQLPDKGRLA